MSPSPLSRRRRRIAGLVLAALVVVFAAVVVRAVVLARATPDYWEDYQAFVGETPEPELEAIARSVESRLPGEWTFPIGEGDGVRTLRVHFDEVNAWLALRLDDYLANQGHALPEQIGGVMLTQRDGQPVIAFDYVSETWGPRVASVFLKFGESEDDSRFAAGIDSAKAGRQPLHLRALTGLLNEHLGLEDAEQQDVLRRLGRRELIEVPRLRVDDRRSADVLGVDVQPQWIDVTVQVAFDDD
ncbi:MAG: hypothetical protein AAFX76_04560 [Planctomycetota bacterium]